VSSVAEGPPHFAFAVACSLFSPQQKHVISTEAAHAFVSCAAEKSASLPGRPPSQRRAFVFAFLFVIPQRSGGICFCFSILPYQENRHFDRSCPRFSEQRSGEIRFSTLAPPQPIQSVLYATSIIAHKNQPHPSLESAEKSLFRNDASSANGVV
jgi:hypothetical protein